jgi:hypothetical protein
MEKVSNFDDIIWKMRTITEQLVPYSKLTSSKLESSMNYVKLKDVVVDGYEIIIHFNKMECDGYFNETLQIYNKNGMFLPFYLIAKIAIKFLGNHYLGLIEMIVDNKKVYCWNVSVDKNGKPILNKNEKIKSSVYEGFEYDYLDPRYVKFH